eukprot:CAMPEP_0117655266 /NCGR_PEP_ID=MMETSP0804-20121206/4189_1 /TAXON_ID=1074897 /ORGANISM="Tetraselmis astigmatica, Strain CCMP880" /LENGTH=191 /DNA_ID=CAMNT_0005461609 /DNA_START=464 /DNA_END=1039 /DNA_ORIENTATION=+
MFGGLWLTDTNVFTHPPVHCLRSEVTLHERGYDAFHPLPVPHQLHEPPKTLPKRLSVVELDWHHKLLLVHERVEQRFPCHKQHVAGINPLVGCPRVVIPGGKVDLPHGPAVMPEQLPLANRGVHSHGDVPRLRQGLDLLRVVTAGVGAAKEMQVVAEQHGRVYELEEAGLALALPVAAHIQQVLYLGLVGA